MGGICSSHKGLRTAYKILIGKPAARDNWRLGYIEGDIITVNLKVVECEV
jgi:hypothetical protein